MDSSRGTSHRLKPGDGVARRGSPSRPQARCRQECRGGEEKPADRVQVGTPHALQCFNDREDETESAAEFMTADNLISESGACIY